MKGKVLLGCVLLSGGLVISYQSVERETVSAETNESISSQKEITPNIVSSSYDANAESEIPLESTTVIEFSSIEEISSSESMGAVTSQAEKVTEESTTEPNLDTSKVPKAVVKVQTPLPAEKVEENYQFSVAKNQTTEEFIQLIGRDAQQIAWDNGLYASVMIAQAILETGSGNSQLARPPHHNLFGIKGSYQGKNVSFNTQEDKGDGQMYTIKSAFRQYPSYKESLEDYAELLRNGLSGNPSFYQETWKEQASTSQEATKALTGKYATDTAYDKKLNALIGTYDLTIYDQEPSKKQAISSIEQASEGGTSSMETTQDQTAKTNTADEPEVITSKTTQNITIPQPLPQRPAKEVAGNQLAR